MATCSGRPRGTYGGHAVHMEATWYIWRTPHIPHPTLHSTTRADADADLEREATRQREYLEKTVDSLKRKLAKDSELHRSDNLRVMQVWLRGERGSGKECMYVGVL